MYEPMTNEGHDTAIVTALYAPERFGAMTPGQFCARYGIPRPDQWDALQELLIYDERGRLRSIQPEGLEINSEGELIGI